MSNLTNLPKIDITTLRKDVEDMDKSGIFKLVAYRDETFIQTCMRLQHDGMLDQLEELKKNTIDLPKHIKLLSDFFNEPYFAFHNTIYVPHAYVIMVANRDSQLKVVATSKIIPWIYAIRDGKVSNLYELIKLFLNTSLRAYYFAYEYTFLCGHFMMSDNDIAKTIALGFISSRKTIIGTRRNPDKMLNMLSEIINTKVVKFDETAEATAKG